ncbi:MAG: 6-phosphogluconolactonase [Alteromonadaceae bacterium]|nr:6-phosphogluconolactonase [Alteromonadaceae bacterium]|tara:strand:- start:948 stop:1673 length:726 start_codon:yes stop_codon:yes gene_type:complete
MRTPESPIGLPENIDWVTAVDPPTLALRLARQVADFLNAAITERGRATLAVSGGRTPVPFFRALSSMKLDWAKVEITLADERWVAPAHPDSNERLVRENLLVGEAASAHFVGLKSEPSSATRGQESTERALAELAWPLDVLVLGMGNDGHTASLFPDAPELGDALAVATQRRCMALHPPSVPQARLSLTRSTLCQARHVLLQLQGKEKKAVLEKALVNPCREDEMPIRAFLRPGLKIYWNP